MSAKKIATGYTNVEIADAMIVPQQLSPKQKKEAANQLAEARKKMQAGMTDKDRLTARLLQFRFRIEDYLDKDVFDPKASFGSFLGEYVDLLNKKRKHFAGEIDIAETELSQLINKHRLPNDNILVRLEIHSNNTISAVSWFKLVEKEKAYALKTNRTLRAQERKFVTGKIAVHL